tara:strand:+ start:646 stop:912 length:267 start_codon:yes stop_codon:yes gene_type:complete
MTSLNRRIRFFKEGFSRKKKIRDAQRGLRITRIREKKKGIARDLAAGHNTGDFNIDKTDLSLVMFIIQNGYGINFTALKNLYEKYRGK